MRHIVRHRLVSLLCVLCAALGGPWRADAQGTSRALLVGISRYPAKPLAGPAFDVASLRDVLIGQWGFDPANVATLVDEAATRSAVLASLDGLVRRSRPGDFVFVYFSGHGTSKENTKLLIAGLEPGTGALVPADADRTSPRRLFDTLIIGRRDLRPRFEALDKIARGLIVIDACYSQDAVRSLVPVTDERPVRFEPLEQDVSAFAQEVASQQRTAADRAYPYERLVALSAAGRAEAAEDIDLRMIRSGRFPTVDGQPHGALTDALLRGLQGEADVNHDARVSVDELYGFVRWRVQLRHRHSPRVALPEGAGSWAFAEGQATANPPVRRTWRRPPSVESNDGPTRVALESEAVQATGLTTLHGVTVVGRQAPYDYLVERYSGPAGTRGECCRLRDAAGEIVAHAPPSALPALVEHLHGAATLEVAGPGNHAFTATIDNSDMDRALNEGEEYEWSFRVSRPAFVLVLDVDPTGHVTTLLPASSGAMTQQSSGTFRGRVVKPVGVEVLKLFAFARKPPWLDNWLGRDDVPADDPAVAQLIRDVTSEAGAEARLKIVTIDAARR